jgi:hypothetical protein
MIIFNLMSSQNALKYTTNCPVKKYMLPLYLGDDGFEIPYCCYGNDVNCDLCGAWAVFHLAAIIKANPGWPNKVRGPFKRVTPTEITI